MTFEREINYWMHMLDECYNIHLCEEKSLLLKKLKEHFGQSLYDTKRSYTPSLKDCQFIFDTINSVKFGSKLIRIPIAMISVNEMKKLCHGSGWFLAAFLRTIQPIKRKPNASRIKKFETDTDTWKLAIVNLLDGKVTVAFLVSCIVHEMIHEFLLQSGRMLNDIERAYNSIPPRIVNDHGDDFMKIISNLNEDGLNIEPYVQKNITYDDLNSKAAEVAKSFNENEENLTDFELAKKVAKELMKINPSIMNAIPNEDGSIMIVSM